MAAGSRNPGKLTTRRNLISGYFKSLAELHWAVLCSRSGNSSLLLYDSLGQLVEKLEGPSEDFGEINIEEG